MNKTIKNNLISIACLALFMLLAIGSTDEDETIEVDISSQASVHTVTATKLYTEYDDNEVAADLKYKDKVITVSGVVDDIAKDILDDIYVTLKGDEYFGTVQCFFSDSHTNKAASLKKGDRLTIKGLCTGTLMGPIIRGCVIN